MACQHFGMFVMVVHSAWAARIGSEGNSNLAASRREDRLDTHMEWGESLYWATANDETKVQMMKGLGCYCKKVKSVDECVDSKGRLEDWDPNRYHWFHSADAVPDSETGDNLCCKLAWNSMFTFVGWSYKRQSSFELCQTEVRPLPSEACCRLEDRLGSIGLRLRQATSWGYQKRYAHAEFFKTNPGFTLDDITGGTDYVGSEVEVEDVREFVQTKLDNGRFPGGLACSKRFKELNEDTEKCTLRESASAECCCHKGTLTTAERCFPMQETTQETEVIVRGELETRSVQGGKEGKIRWAEDPDDVEKSLPDLLKSVDPEAADDPDTAANESAMEFDWAKGSQWQSVECLETAKVPHVRSQKKSKRVRAGTTSHRVGKVMVHRHKYRTKRWTEYHQEYTTKCIAYKYKRECPVGQGRYVKQIPHGTCVKEPKDLPEGSEEELVLVDIGALSFMCPEDYQSGTPGSLNFNQRCECDTDC
mmetsp:Transcript_41276/g.76814  ORF Transcript_41276/g.76814 Transcript_41276/m.76814 type:complete len:477 (+) Transcript_41276:67-1497(+)